MAVSLKHPFTSAKSDGGTATLVKPSDWNAEHTTSMSTSRLLGKSDSGTGSIAEIPLAATLSFDIPNKTLNIVATGYEGIFYQLFTSNGTWTKPTGATIVFVRCVGAGGGGTSGRVANFGPAGLNIDSVGGDGGLGGSCVEQFLNASSLTSTVSVTLGSGGAGGASATGSTPNAGSRGGTTSFGSYVYAAGGGSTSSVSVSNYPFYHGYSSDIAVYGIFLTNPLFNGSSSLFYNGFSNPLSPAQGAFGSFVDTSDVPTHYRGGVGFANQIAAPTTYAQTGGSVPYGTSQAAATSKGYGGGGGTSRYVSSGSVSATSGYAGYLGGGGGGGGCVYTTSTGTGTAGAGGAGGAGYVEVFSW